MTRLAIIPLRPNPKPKRKKKSRRAARNGRRPNKAVRGRSGYLVQGWVQIGGSGRPRYIGHKGKFGTLARARVYPDLFTAKAAMHDAAKHPPKSCRWIQIVAA